MIEIEFAVVISVISVLIGFGGLIFTIITLSHNRKKDIVSDTEKQAMNTTRVMTRLESIGDDVKDIKAEYRNVRGEIQKVKEDLSSEIKAMNSEFNDKFLDLTKDVLKVEMSATAAHNRLDIIGAPRPTGKEE